LSLRNPSAGTKISFVPDPFQAVSTSPVIDELIERIDAARRRR
jgi:hypothetical protein